MTEYNKYQYELLFRTQVIYIITPLATLVAKSPSKLGFNSLAPLKLIRQAHCNIPAGGADTAAVGAVASVGDVLKGCI